jgi:hypothetical protein
VVQFLSLRIGPLARNSTIYCLILCCLILSHRSLQFGNWWGLCSALLCNVVEILLILQIICSLILHFFYYSLLGLIGVSLFSINICEVLVVFN